MGLAANARIHRQQKIAAAELNPVAGEIDQPDRRAAPVQAGAELLDGAFHGADVGVDPFGHLESGAAQGGGDQPRVGGGLVQRRGPVLAVADHQRQPLAACGLSRNNPHGRERKNKYAQE